MTRSGSKSGWAAIVLPAILSVLPVGAHEVRPALLEISESPDHGFAVQWKQPRRGEAAIRLVPHLSNGWLETAPTETDANPAYAIKVWNDLRTGASGLEGQTVTIEGLEQTMTDVLIGITLADGRKLNEVLRPKSPSLRIDFRERHGLPVSAYLTLGIGHILTGIDHLLFVFGLLLLVGSRWRLLQTVTAFTVAHSLTLAGTALGLIHVKSAVVETLVALSIVFLALELIHLRRGRAGLAVRFPWLIAFSFGLLHGMAFAGALAEVGLPSNDIPLSLLLFNVGVEAGQLIFVAGILAIAWAIRRIPPALPGWTGWIAPYGIGSFAAFWFIQRFSILIH